MLEMAFAARCGLRVNVPANQSALEYLFAEELGAVIQVSREQQNLVMQVLAKLDLAGCVSEIAVPDTQHQLVVMQGGRELLNCGRAQLQQAWSETSYVISRLRDRPECADQEFAAITQDQDPGLSPVLSFDPKEDICAPYIQSGQRPKLAILREQGVNGQIEMAAAFTRAGFQAVDVHMSDLIAARTDLDSFSGLVACGGFSYGDVLGAGRGWANAILFDSRLSDQFQAFFERKDRFAFGVCNGCQMMAELKSLIPGAAHWPHFVRNHSEQFEARLSMVEVMKSESILLRDMVGSKIPVAVAHGEGRVSYRQSVSDASAAALRYVDHWGKQTEHYPDNPNGSASGATGFCNEDGRITIMMPHPERVFRTLQMSWHPDHWGEDSPWMRLFRNARAWVG